MQHKKLLQIDKASSDLDKQIRQLLMILIQCIDWNRSGRKFRTEALIGETRVTINQLLRMRSSQPISLHLIHPKKARRKKSYVNSGVHFGSIVSALGV
ncbi:hypothetical protein ACTXT7_001757 [Hymenolepis weldensis]